MRILKNNTGCQIVGKKKLISSYKWFCVNKYSDPRTYILTYRKLIASCEILNLCCMIAM